MMDTAATARAPGLRVVSDEGGADAVAANAPTGLPESPEGTRKGGRPKGSRNKVSADARALIATAGIPALKALCAIAAGRPIFRTLKGGSRERIDPELPDIIAAQKFIVSRLVPELKAQELTGKDGAPLVSDGPMDNRQTARAILSLLSSGVPGSKVTVEEPGTHVARFKDPDLANRVFPAGASTGGEGVAAAGAGTAPAAPLPEPDPPYYGGQTYRPFRGDAPFIQCTDGQRWQLLEKGGIIVGEDHPNIRAASRALFEHAGNRFPLLKHEGTIT